MQVFSLAAKVALDRPLEEVFDFFARAGNLERITPPWLRFRILTPRPVDMRRGTRIDYRLRWRGIPLRWQSEISQWEPPHYFVDEQRRGPYRLWFHEHRFDREDGRTVVRDRIEYAVLGGRLIDRWIVRPDLKRIFRFRRKLLLEILGDN